MTAAGQRTYTLYDLAEQARQVTALADPLGNATEDSEPQAMDPNAVADGNAGPLAAALEDSRLVTQIMELYPEAQPPQGRLSVTYLTGDALWLVESDPASGCETVNGRTLSHDRLTRLVEHALQH